MGTLQADGEEKQEMDDSGCVQDESSSFKGQVQLLDLSDDVLLLILKHLAPYDLKAVGYTCPRLGALILDRSLWVTVDARDQPTGRVRLRWLLAHALHSGTRELLLSGYAREAKECMGHVNQSRQDIEAAVEKAKREGGGEGDGNSRAPAEDASRNSAQPQVIDIPAIGANARLYINEEEDNSSDTLAWAWPPAGRAVGADKCPGPQFTVAPASLRRLADKCRLTALALDHCNINCGLTSISHFPPTLKKLSLVGSKCYNLPLDRSFLFKIQDALPDLESLDVSECDWMEPASLLPLSKLPRLLRLRMRGCHRMTEFVAYASLATRYGFTKLESLDLRGSPVGDSEVSALGWLAALRELRLSPARRPLTHSAQHAHHAGDPLPPPLDPPPGWERQEPEYYKIPADSASMEQCTDPERNCSDQNEPDEPSSSSNASDTRNDAPKRKASPSGAGPSKRKRNDPVPTLGSSPGTSDEDTPRDSNPEPRHQILYVNVGQQLHSVYRLSLLNQNVFSPENAVPFNPSTIFPTHASLHLDGSSLVTDSAVRRFGRADGEDINIVNIGPNGPYIAPNMPGARPNRSSLRHLSITGFRHITDRSLTHLSTAAPDLQCLDLSRTNVTAQGVESFKSFRPDCEVIFSPYVERTDETKDEDE